MRTLALNSNLDAESNIQNALTYFTYRGERTYDRDLTAILAFTDRDPYFLHFPRFSQQTYGDIQLPDKLKSAIVRWCDKGKGWGILHSRGYPALAKARNERMPLKLSNNHYFFHLGGYGSGVLWNEVTSARRMRRATNYSVYAKWLACQTIDSNAVNFPMMWANLHTLDNDMIRSHSSFIWNDGNIEKYNIHMDSYDESSTTRYQVCKMNTDDDNIHEPYVYAFADYPQWDGVE